MRKYLDPVTVVAIAGFIGIEVALAWAGMIQTVIVNAIFFAVMFAAGTIAAGRRE